MAYISAIAVGVVAALASAATALFAVVDYTQVWVATIAAVASVANTFILVRVNRGHKETAREVHDVKKKVSADRREEDN